VTVDGIKPLMTHNPQSMGGSSGPVRGSRVPAPEVEAEAGTYRMEDGVCAIKGESFRAALLNAASAWRIKRGTAKRMVAHIVVVEEMLPLYRRDGSPIRDYVIDSRRAIVQGQGIIRNRPKFDEWSCEFTIEFEPLLIDNNPQLLVDILADGGNRFGVGDYRPEHNGYFGRFRIRSWHLED
jgi:hypothetical protein